MKNTHNNRIKLAVIAHEPESHARKGVSEWLSVQGFAPRRNPEKSEATAVRPWSFTFIYVAILFFLAAPAKCFADTIVLNDGKKIDGLIVEKSDSFIKVDVEGVELKFYNKDIKEIIPGQEGLVIANEKYAELEQNSLLGKVLELSNVKKQVESLPAHVNDEYAQYKERIPAQIYESGSKIMAESYGAKDVYASVVDYFKANYKRDYLLKIKEFLNSELSEKISGLEDKAAGSNGLKEMKEFANTLSQKPPPEERAELIKKLDEAVGATNMQIETVITMYKGMNLAIDPVVAADKRLTPGELDMVTTQMRKELKNILKNVISISFLYTYQSLSDEELKQYLNFWSSDAGKWFNKVSNEAFIAAMDKAGQRATSQFIKLAGENKNSASQKEPYFFKKGGEWIRK
ncbi:MAG: hypothetical protein M0R48_09355 [Candidatus Omnitrophica bacterium]|jgi:hypothetical protein|nr:hypothetical protein [Candidatus Omnitrophota bacterium]